METTLNYSYVISAVIGLICWRQISFQPLRVLAVYWAITVLIDLNLEQFDAGDGKLIRFFYCLLYPMALGVYVYLFNYEKSSKFLEYWIQWVAVAIVAVVSISYILFNLDKITAANDIFLIQGTCTLYVVLLYFHSILVSNKVMFLSEEPLFWVATGVLFYNAGNVIASGFYHQIYSYSKDLAIALYKLNYILNIVMSVTFSIAFIISAKKISIRSDGY